MSADSRLEDCQNSLAVALARVEAYRCRERLLIRENQALRAALQKAGVQPQTVVPPAAAAAEELNAPHLRQAAADPSDAAQLGTTASTADALYITPHSGGYPVLYLASEGKVPGSVIVTEDALEFVQARAKVTATEFLGMRSLPQQSEANGTTWNGRARDEGSGAAGVISGTAAWLLQRVRRGSSAGGGAEEPTQADDAASSDSAAGMPTLSDMVRTILHPDQAEDAESSDEEQQPADQPARWDSPFEGVLESEAMRAWEVLWKDGGGEGQLQSLAFEATRSTRALLHKQVEAWSASLARSCTDAMQKGESGLQEGRGQSAVGPVEALSARMRASRSEDGSVRALMVPGLELELAEPRHLVPGAPRPSLSEPSSFLTDAQVRGLAAALPARYQLSRWNLQYSSARHGVSLHTMYRRSQLGPCILVVRDTAGFVFGCFTTLPWKPSPRYYGTGETFVFQLQPHMVSWGWKRSSGPRNDFFIFAAPNSIGVGGGGHFAIFLEGELLHGTSGISETFGNPCLACNEEFAVGKVELWGLI